LTTEVSQRVAFADSVAAGRLVGELAPAGTAAREIHAFTRAVQELWS
jgi:chromosome partitioning protein